MAYAIYVILTGLSYFAEVLIWVLFLQALLSWFVAPYNRLYCFLARFSDPLRMPFRKISEKLIRKGLRIDLSSLFAMISLELLQRLFLYLRSLCYLL